MFVSSVVLMCLRTWGN